MFSDRDATDRALHKMIENDDHYDPGLDALQKAMRVTEAEINSPTYRDSPRDCPSYEDLNKKWEFYGSAVDIVGKVYIADESFGHVVPDDWELGGTDEYGTWFLVPKMTFVSNGICTVIAAGEAKDDPDAGKRRVGYSLILPEDINRDDEDDDVALFFAFPDEAIPEFQRLSSTAINFRLHTRYPEVMKRIDEVLPTGSANMSRKLHRLRDVLADTEMDDESEVDWLCRYIIDKLEGDTAWPYIIRLSHEIGLSDAYGESEKITLEAPLEQYVRIESFSLSYTPGAKGVKGILILISAPGRQSTVDEQAEKIYAPLESIDNIRSVRPHTSLREQLDNGRVQKMPADVMARIVEKVVAIDQSPRDTTPDKSSKEPHIHRETKLDRLRKQQKALADIEQLVRDGRQAVYANREDALADTTVLVQEIASILRSAELFGVTLTAMGEGLMRPEVNYTQTSTGFSIDTEYGSVVPVNPFEVRTGPLVSIVPQLERILDDSGGVAYKHDALLLLGNPTRKFYHQGDQTPLVNAMVTESTLVKITSLTSTTEIAAHRVLRERIELFEALREREDTRSQSIVGTLTRIERALYHDTPQAFVGLRHVEWIREVAQEIMTEHDDDLALKALSSLFAPDQIIMLAGKLATKEGDVEAQVRGKFAGFVTDYPFTDHPRLSFVLVTNDNACHYFPADGVKGLAF